MFAHKNLSVWKESLDLAFRVYQITKQFPKSELFGLTIQIRKCVSSIPANISEGAARNSDREYIRFLRIALGSLAELDSHLELSKKLDYIGEEDYILLTGKMKLIGAQLAGLIKYLGNKSTH